MKDAIISMVIILVAFVSFVAGAYYAWDTGYERGKRDGAEAVYLKLRDKCIQESEEVRCLPPET